MFGRGGSLRGRDRLGHRCGPRDRSGRHALLRGSRRGLLTAVGGFADDTRPGHLGRTIGKCRLTVLTGTVHDRPRRVRRNRSRSGDGPGLGCSHLRGVRTDAPGSGLTRNARVLRGNALLRLGAGGRVSRGADRAGRVTRNPRALRQNALLRLGDGLMVSCGADRAGRVTRNLGLGGGHLLISRADACPSRLTLALRVLRGDVLLRLAGRHLVTGGRARRRRALCGLLDVGALRGLLGVGGLRRRCRVGRLRGDAGCDGLGRARRLCLWNNRFRRRRPGAHRGLGRDLRAPGRGRLRGRLRGARGVEILGAGRRRCGLSCRRFRGAAVGERADRAGGAVGEGRAEVQRPARGDGRDRRRVGQADAAEVDRAAVAARELVRARLVHGLDDRLRRGRGDLVAPGAMGAGQQQVFVLGGVLGEVGVRTVRGGARLFHHACVLRQSLARDLAGVGHAYPSPIG
ncbi:hypothetical protein PV963_08710 [Streptomyces coeruleorubidus]|nr:hypothetical protein [Streptomyces coeruleorubidus]WDV50436.1 hypothetical protein PV963_08710 [Streptomyces coeruleorubidus]